MPKKTPRSLAANRSRLAHKVGYALNNPTRVAPYVRRAARDPGCGSSTPTTSATTGR